MIFDGNGTYASLVEAKEKFETLFGDLRRSVINLAPASLILLGDHTHYNEGVLLATAVNRYCIIIMRKRKDNIINLASMHSPVPESFSLLSLENVSSEKFRMSKNLIRILLDEKIISSGFDCLISNNIPESLGLGASSAQQVGFAMAVKKIFDSDISTEDMLKLTRKNDFQIFGKISNPAHHYTVAFGKQDKLFHLDLKTNEYKTVSINSGGYSIVIFETGEVIENVQNTCNERIEECEVGVKGLRLYIWGIKNLRDVEMDFLSRHVHMLPRRIFNRVYYNVNERSRCEEAVKLLRKNSLDEFGSKIFESHSSLAGDYDLSIESLDFIVENAKSIEGVLGAKMISCSPKRSVFCIVENSKTEKIISEIKNSFTAKYHSELRTHVLKMADGIKRVPSKKIAGALV